MYLGVSLSRSALKILETVDASAPDGYEQLLKQRYQPTDQVALHGTQLRAKHQGLKETLGDFGDNVERVVRLAYSNVGAEVADDLGRDTFIAGLHNQELQKWVHQARTESFVEARAQTPGGPDHLSQMLEHILARLDAGGVAPPWRPGGGSGAGKWATLTVTAPITGNSSEGGAQPTDGRNWAGVVLGQGVTRDNVGQLARPGPERGQGSEGARKEQELGPGVHGLLGQEEQATAGWVGTVVHLDNRDDLLTAGFLLSGTTHDREVEWLMGIYFTAVIERVGAGGWGAETNPDEDNL